MTVKRFLLLAIFVFVLALSVIPTTRIRNGAAWAQAFTPTPTFTPFGASPLVTPTPTKLIKVVNEITHPKSGDAVSGFVRIIGYAAAPSFRKYDVHIAVAGSESWQWLTTNLNPVYDDVIYLLDTTRLRDGFYDVRVRVMRDDGNYTEAFLRDMEVRNINPPTLTPALNALGTLLPTPTPTVVTPTPTVTPEFLSNIPDGQGIFIPYNNAVLRGLVKIIGTVNERPNRIYDRYELAISPAGHENWTLLVSSDEQIWQNTIYKLDTSQFADGLYDLRLRIVYEDSNYDEYQVRNLYIANHTDIRLPTATPTPPTKGIFIPPSGSMISGTLSITGTATILNFRNWELAWSPSGEEQWSLLVNANQPVGNGLLVRLDVRNLPPGEYDLRLRVFNWNNQFEEYFTRRLQITAPTPTPTVTFTPTSTPFPTPGG